ncbi:cytochrome P450/oxidoreductase [Tranquillimonas alkanivorans]|uniref:Cytochrome P450 n=1 Tax=Tranquillimonas alkanivorans TaxID=441119 RepID=A0A1I5NN49_9RHOB|nr:cytochrome P450/oxidoreductase [Tranquillimonas alkanivorans]SFP23258.1 Cytochrome P450 [Tranquillimonas alkanivorans]
MTDVQEAQRATGCPFSEKAQAFDPFGAEYQFDPAEALRWSREQEPVFYASSLGYWVVSRYDDIKAIFRDNIAFSPAIALEKITPVSQEAIDALNGYGYAMNRTLVNEDEPQHTERRRALMSHFEPARLEGHEEMVRRLTREALDRIVDRGEADLVDEMLWEIPLTVALHFLGVPEDDMAKLREFSVAHTVNTWGRPTKEEQVGVAHAVGKFWQYSGQVLEKMRANPDMPGWMPYAIRKQKELPEVVTDSYLHSMMMAIIVAAHETTAHASANMFRRLLENRELWDEVCAAPSLIPNTVEECLRHSGSVVAWRRIATKPVTVGGVDLPEGAKILMVTASANHDPRQFENPDELDIFRDNTTDHLTFGYGSHQCMGKNLARLEMRIFLEEFTRRLPHMELVEQEFTFVPNTSFRGPEHLLVRWDPAKNPERTDPQAREPRLRFEVGAPNASALSRPVVVAEREEIAEGVVRLSLADPKGRDLPRWSAGGHVDLLFGDYERKYSLCGDPARTDRLQIAVLREPESRGGSVWLHDNLQPGTELSFRGPKNHFPLDEHAERYVLIAGGIGITPILAMADRLKHLGKDYELHYAGRTRAKMAFLDRLMADHGERLNVYSGDEGRRMDLTGLAGGYEVGRQVYACGPDRLLDAIGAVCADWPEGALHVEHFTAGASLLDPEHEQPFEAELADSGFTVTVAADQTLLDALRAAGIDVASDCEEGLCGTCEVGVLDGDVDHRDKVLSAAEHRESKRLMACCSRGKGKLRLAL